MPSDNSIYKFLVVEDNPGDFILIEDLLIEQFTEAVITNATTFKQASALLEAEKTHYDAILLDLGLPDKSGDELIKLMLKKADLIPIIVLTGNSNVDYSVNAISLGVSDYLVKDDLTKKMLHKSILYAINRKLILENLRTGEAKLNEAQAIAKVGNWETDLSSMKVTWSNETFRIFGLNPDNFPSTHPAFLEYVHPDDRAKVDDAFVNSFGTDTINSIEHRIITANGLIKIVDERWQIIRDGLGNPIRAVGTCQDITERKIVEEQQEKLTNDIIQRNRDLEQFTFIISHNLRAPTANIIGFAEILQDETLSPEEQKESLKGLSDSVSGLDAIIKDINSILQVKREVNERKELISFSKLVNYILISIGNPIDKNNVCIKSDFSEVDEIFSLKVYLHSIFYNLISNSIKYSKPDEHPLIEIKSKKENGKIILTFKDNGLGIDMKSKGNKVFGLYRRFHSHVEGKGMGLFMVKTQVEAIGGTISVTSELNKGTEFTITLIS